MVAKFGLKTRFSGSCFSVCIHLLPFQFLTPCGSTLMSVNVGLFELRSHRAAIICEIYLFHSVHISFVVFFIFGLLTSFLYIWATSVSMQSGRGINCIIWSKDYDCEVEETTIDFTKYSGNKTTNTQDKGYITYGLASICISKWTTFREGNMCVFSSVIFFISSRFRGNFEKLIQFEFQDTLQIM